MRHRRLRTLAVPAAAGALAALAGCGGSTPGAETTTTATATIAAKPPRRSTGFPPSPGLQRAAVAHYAEAGRPVFCGGRRRRLVALTFDDGPGPYTRIALRELRAHDAHATFFLVGDSVRRFPEGARLLRNATEHAIGEHTVTHANLPTLSFGHARDEIAGGRAIAEGAVGQEVHLFRPPYGAHDQRIDSEVARQGMAQILWDVDSADSDTGRAAGFHDISRTVRREVRPGSIVLMHENRGQTIRALRAVLPMLERRGYRMVTVPELLAADPPSRRRLEAGAEGCGVGERAASRR